MRINHNMLAMNTHRQMGITGTNQGKAMEKLSSGLRINRAGDDAAGLSISEKMRGQIRGLEMASKNSQDGISMIQTGEGALAETQAILQRMRELAVQSANDTNVGVDRGEIQKEMNQLTSEINRIGNTTEFNTQKILNGGMDSNDGLKITDATAATKILSGDLGSTKAESTTGVITDGKTTVGTAAETADIVYAAGKIAKDTWIKVDGVMYTNKDEITLTGGAGSANAALIADGFTDENGNKLSTVANVAQGSDAAKITIESKSKGALSSVAVQAETSLTGGSAVTTVNGNGTAMVVDGKEFDISGFDVKTSTVKELNETIEKLGNIESSDGTKLSDLVEISWNEDVANTRLTFTTISSGEDSSIRFESFTGNTATVDAALGLSSTDYLGADNQKTGEVAEGATKTLTSAATTGTVTASGKADIKFTTATGETVGANSIISINGHNFVVTGAVSGDGTTDAEELWTAIKDLKSDIDPNLKLQDLVDKTIAGADLTLETKEKGAANKISFTNTDTATGLTTAQTKAQGDGTAIKVGEETFELGEIEINVDTEADRLATIERLGNATVTGGTKKLSEVVDISFDEDLKLKFEAKAVGPDASIEIMSSAADTALGTAAATDLGVTNRVEGTGSVGAISEGTKITVNNTTFNLGGVELANPNDEASVIEAIGSVTSGGVKLSDLVDIEVKDGKLSFTTKSTGDSSTIQFEGDDGVLGLTASDAGAANAVTGDDTSIESAGLQGSSALSTDADVEILDGSSFRIALGTDSDITVNLKGKTYNTSNEDANVAKAAMDELVKDINTELQKAGLSGKVSASLSKDNEIQFISEQGIDIELKDGINSPLKSVLGFSDTSDLSGMENVDKVVGPGAEGSGFTAKLQVGANQGQSMQINIDDMRASALGITGNAGEKGFTSSTTVTDGTSNVMSEAALDVSDHESASAAVEVINDAIERVSAQRSSLGAVQNRLEHTIKNLDTSAENLQAAEARVRDVDMAKEMMNLSKQNILQQASQAMMAQANQSTQGVLQLLR